MLLRTVARSSRTAASIYRVQTFASHRTIACLSRSRHPSRFPPTISSTRRHPSQISASFHTSYPLQAQSPTADVLMENLNELYSTARDEFEIAVEETEKKTVYAADDREAAADALNMLKEAFQKALKETSPEVSKEIQGRVGQRIRELENAVKAMEELAMED